MILRKFIWLAGLLAITCAALPVSAQTPHGVYDRFWQIPDANEVSDFFAGSGIEDYLGTSRDNITVKKQFVYWNTKATLFRATGGWEPKTLSLYYLRAPDGSFHWLDGKAGSIYKFNRAYAPEITEKSVLHYLWFYTFFVRGPQGPFLMIESKGDRLMPNSLVVAPENLARPYRSVYDIPRPATCVQGDAGKFECSLTILYYNSIFDANMEIRPDGKVSMTNDTPLVVKLKQGVYAPISLEHLNEDFTPLARPEPQGIDRVSGLSDELASLLRSLDGGKSIRLDDKTIPFLGGMSASMLSRCALPKDPSAKWQLQSFTATSLIGSIMGSDYSNPDLRKALGSAARQQAMFAAGELVTNQIGCGASLDRLGNTIAKIIKASKSSDNLFVETCTGSLGKSSCTCLANLGRQVVPNIKSRRFERSIIGDIVRRNPFLGLAIGVQCGISNY